MGSVLGRWAGGILGLFGFLDDHQEAIEYDLIALDLRLRDFPSDRADWGDLLAIVRQSARTSALGRSVDPEGHEWDVNSYLLAITADALRAANWQRGKRGPRPKPIPRPGDKSKARKFGTKPMTIAQMDEWLASKRANAKPARAELLK